MTESQNFHAEVFQLLREMKDQLNNIEENTTKKVRKISEKKQADKAIEIKVDEIISYWNEKFGKDIKTTSKAHRVPILARLNEGYKFHDFAKVIANKKDDPWFVKTPAYFMPKTLFGNKFDVYLQCGKIEGDEVDDNNSLFDNEHSELF